MGQQEPHQNVSVDRTWLQDRITDIEQRVRRRLRGKLRAVGSGAYDIDDVLSSTRRRVDKAVISGRMDMRSGREFEAYIFRVASRIATDVWRRQRREQRFVHAFGSSLAADGPAAPLSDVIELLLHRLQPYDRAVMEMWARGVTHASIARAMGIGFEAHRSRWRRMWKRLHLIAGQVERP